MATGRITGRTLFLFTTTILAAVAIYSAADNTVCAQETERSFNFNIPVKPVRQAINEIGKITGLAVVFNETGAASVRGSAVRGSLTSSQAVASLLQGTGLSYKFTNSNTVTIFAV